MEVFIIGITGITGGVGGRLTRELLARGDGVHGLVRRRDQQVELAARGVDARIGDLSSMTARHLAAAFGDVDAVVFSAGSNGGSKQVTRAIDGGGFATAIEAADLAGVTRLVSVSVHPEAWRERDLDDEEEYYFSVKKQADIRLSHSDLDWLILRPSLLHDEKGVGRVSLGPAEPHGRIARDDVAATLGALLHEPRLGRQILELDTGPTPIEEAVRANVRSDGGSRLPTPP